MPAAGSKCIGEPIRGIGTPRLKRFWRMIPHPLEDQAMKSERFLLALFERDFLAAGRAAGDTSAREL